MLIHYLYILTFEFLCSGINFDPSGLVTFWFSEGQLLRPLVLLFFYFTKITYEREVTQIRNMLKIGERKGSKVYFRELQCVSSKSSLIGHIRLFNALSFEVKILNTMRLKRKLKKLSVTFTDWRTILQGILATKNPENTVDTLWESPPDPSICLSW